jgi:hypothetical protein
METLLDWLADTEWISIQLEHIHKFLKIRFAFQTSPVDMWQLMFDRIENKVAK